MLWKLQYIGKEEEKIVGCGREKVNVKTILALDLSCLVEVLITRHITYQTIPREIITNCEDEGCFCQTCLLYDKVEQYST